MDSLSSEVRLRLEGSVENLNALDIEVKEKIINQVQDIFKNIVEIEGEIASFEKMINMLLENNELRYWLNQRDFHQSTFDSTLSQYNDAMKKNTNWVKEMRKRGYTEEQIKKFNDDLNENLESLRNTLNGATEKLNQAKVALEQMSLFSQYEELKKQMQLSKDKFENLKYVFVNNNDVARIDLNQLISDVKESEKYKKVARDYQKNKESKADFLKRMGRPKPQKLFF